MLVYFVILVLILSGAIAFYYFQTPVYKIKDKILGYPDVMGFDKQNCQLDGSCWVKYVDSPEYEPRNPLRPPFKGWNSVLVNNEWKMVDMPPQFFDNGSRGWGYYASANYPI